MGRLSTFSQAIADEICDRLALGEPLAQICRDDHMPAYRTVSEWKGSRVEFAAQFGRAREDGHDAIAARLRLTTRGKGEEDGGDSSGDVQRDKLIVETDLKLLAKWDPRRYGESVQLKHSGNEGQAIDLTDSGAAARMAALLEAVRQRSATSETGPDAGSTAQPAIEPND